MEMEERTDYDTAVGRNSAHDTCVSEYLHFSLGKVNHIRYILFDRSGSIYTLVGNE